MTPIIDNPSVKYAGHGLWQLTEDYVYLHSEFGPICVPEGFISDLDSVPRLPFAYLLTKNASVIGAVVHDYLYESGKIRHRQITRAEADRIFLDLMEEEGVSWWQRRMIYTGVRIAGWGIWARHRKNDEQEPDFI